MKFFLTHESQSPATALIVKYREKLFPIIKDLVENSFDSYGTDVEKLCIISTCVSKQFLADSGWKERVRYIKLDKTTDIRLNIDWELFLTLNPEDQYNMYFDNIIRSIQKFHLKYPKLDFKAPKLIDDIINIVDNTRE